MYKIIKLTNGTEVIGDVLFNQEDHNLIAINKPMQINYRLFQNAVMPSISLVKYTLLGSNEPVVFSMKDVLNVIEPKKMFVDYYTATVDSAFEHYDHLIDRELGLAIERNTGEEPDPYQQLLENFSSETMN